MSAPARMPFLVTSKALDERTRLVAVSGEVDLATAPCVEGEFTREQIVSGMRIVVDLSNTMFFDARLLGALVRIDRLLRRRAGRLVVVCPSSWQRRVFALMGMNGRFGIVETCAEALEMVDGEPPLLQPPRSA